MGRGVSAAGLFREEACGACLLITTLLWVSCLESHIARHYQVSEVWSSQRRKPLQQLEKIFPE